MRNSFLYTLFLLAVLICNTAEAQQFSTERIKLIFDKLSERGTMPDSLSGFMIDIDKTDGNINSIGVSIPNINFLNDSLLENLAQQKVLEIILSKNQRELMNTLDHNKSKIFFNGANYMIGPLWDLSDGLNTIKNNESITLVRDSLDFAIVWKSKESEFALSFPANIQAITGKDKIELESELEAMITKQPIIQRDSLPANSSEMTQQGDVYINDNGSYILDNVSNRTYYSKLPSGKYELIYNPEKIVETFSNMFSVAPINSVRLNIEQRMYGDQINVFETTLKQLLAFCDNYELTPYVGIESVDNELLEATIILYNKRYNYIHLLHVKTNVDTLMNSQDAAMYCRLYSYISIDNIAEIYSDGLE